MSHYLGKHFILELSGCPYHKLNDPDFVEDAMLGAAKDARATIVTSTFHTFNPYGVSGVVVIAESHITIHTWPEVGYAALDVFTCGGNACPERAVESLIQRFGAVSHQFIEIRRGVIDDENQTASPRIEIVRPPTPC